MLSSILAFPAFVGGPGSDTSAARLTDPRFRGIRRIDLKASYGARCDGTSHPLTGLYGSLAAAVAAYPNAGLTRRTGRTRRSIRQPSCRPNTTSARAQPAPASSG